HGHAAAAAGEHAVGVRPSVRHHPRPRRRRHLRRLARRHDHVSADAARRLRARLRAAAMSVRALVTAALVAGCSAAAAPAPPTNVLSVSVEQASAWTRNFNPLLVGAARWPTRSGIYEPLMIWNAPAATWVPWLATDRRWSADR